MSRCVCCRPCRLSWINFSIPTSTTSAWMLKPITFSRCSKRQPPRPKVPKGPQRPEEVITYDYRGFKTSSLTGPMLVDGDEGESGQYQKLLALQKGGEWKKLLKESTREIKKVPDWLTPYAFKAVALQHLGNNQEAIKALEYVDQRSVGNPDYDQVRSLLQHLKTAK